MKVRNSEEDGQREKEIRKRKTGEGKKRIEKAERRQKRREGEDKVNYKIIYSFAKHKSYPFVWRMMYRKNVCILIILNSQNLFQ